MARLQPAAAQALLASFRTEMAAAVEQGLQAHLPELTAAPRTLTSDDIERGDAT